MSDRPFEPEPRGNPLFGAFIALPVAVLFWSGIAALVWWIVP